MLLYIKLTFQYTSYLNGYDRFFFQFALVKRFVNLLKELGFVVTYVTITQTK